MMLPHLEQMAGELGRDREGGQVQLQQIDALNSCQWLKARHGAAYRYYAALKVSCMQVWAVQGDAASPGADGG